MQIPNCIILLACFATAASASIDASDGELVTIKPRAYQAPSPDVNVTTFVTMTRSKRSAPILRMRALHKRQLGVATAKALPLWLQMHLAGNTGLEAPEKDCKFGPLYKPGKEFEVLPNVHFNTTYGDSNYLRGPYGMSKVTIGGITVNQRIALATEAGWPGDGITSGLIGLAYPSGVQSFKGAKSLPGDGPESQVTYNPLFRTMWKMNKIPAVFSLAISRPSKDPSDNCPDGYLAFGGLAPVATQGSWAVAPLEYVPIGPGYINSSLPYPQYQWYTISPDSFLFSGTPYTSSPRWTPLNGSLPATTTPKRQWLLDSGVTLTYLPTLMANHVASLYVPPAVFHEGLEGYAVACNAKTPNIAVKINGVVLPFDPKDMVVDDGTGEGTCMTGVADGKEYAPWSLGDSWMKNVMVVHDIGAAQLRIRSRVPY